MLEIIILVLVIAIIFIGFNFVKSNKKFIALKLELESALKNAENQAIAQNKIINLEQNINNLTTELAKEKTAIEFLQSNIQEKDNKINDLANKLTNEQNIINQQNSNLAKEKTEINFLQNQLNEKNQIISNLENQNNDLTNKLNEIKQLFAKKTAELQEKENSFNQQKQDFIEIKNKLTLEFQNLANKVLQDKSDNFKNTNKSELNHLLEPLKNKIDGFQNRMNEIHNKQVADNSKLEKELQNMMNLSNHISKEANNLTKALKGNNKIMGNWGELQLITLLEKAGLQEGQQFIAQQSFNNQNKQSIPDVVIKLPDNKNLIIDSKVSLIDFEKAVNSDDKNVINEALKAHAKSIRNHIDNLSKKNYQAIENINSPNFVFMFVPIEGALTEAMRFDNEIFEYAFNKNIFLVSQNSLLAMLKVVGSMWLLAESSREMNDLKKSATELYDVFNRIFERLSAVGKSINKAKSDYDKLCTSFKGQQGIFNKIEKFKRISPKANNSDEIVKFQQNIDLIDGDGDCDDDFLQTNQLIKD